MARHCLSAVRLAGGTLDSMHDFAAAKCVTVTHDWTSLAAACSSARTAVELATAFALLPVVLVLVLPWQATESAESAMSAAAPAA